jgi:NOL1/NOP2/fmu family ribosome biogenesis protein
MFRKEEAAVTDWSEDTVHMCANRQAEILDHGSRLVRPGGRLVYSTCTFAPEENEETVLAFLERSGEFVLEDVEAPWFQKVGTGMFRLWPHKLLGEGHFVAVMRKMGNEECPESSEKGEKLPKEWEEFAREMGISLPAGKAIFFGQTLYWAPSGMPELRGIKVLRPGLELGESRKGRFLPAHALALWLNEGKNTISFPADSKEITAYLHGETLPGSVKGWCVVQVDGFSIGWGKGDGTIIKNH